MLEEFKWILIYLFIKVKNGGALVHVYVWEHIVTLNYRITWWIFTKLCRDKVLKTPLICLGADPAQGHNTSIRGLFSKELLLQSGMLQQQTECIAIIYKHLGVLMTPAHLYWLLGQIRTVVDPGQGHNGSDLEEVFAKWAIFSFFQWFLNFQWAISFHSTQTFMGHFPS